MAKGRFEGKVVMVTGMASGIGQGVVQAFAKEGAIIAGGDFNEESGKKEIESLVAQGTKAFFHQLDITHEDEVEGFVKEVIKQYGRIDVSVNTAGAAKLGFITDMATEDFDFTLKTCMYSIFYNMKYVGREMKKTGGGAIVNVSSANSTVPYLGYSGYCAAKSAVDMITKVAALEFGPNHIRVNVVSPGLIQTPMTRDFTNIPAVKAEYLGKTPVGRLGDPKDVANAIMFFADENNGYVTGVRMLVDGGQDLEGYPDIFDAEPGLIAAIGHYDDQYKG